MQRLRKRVISLVILLVLFVLPAGALANGYSATLSSNPGSIHKQLNSGLNPYESKLNNQDFQNPNDYPLINNGELIGVLTDSVGSAHYLTYASTAEESSSQMDVQIDYQNYDYYKDPYLNIEFYTDKSGTMTYLGNSLFDVSGVNGEATLGITVDKSLYANDPYIYMRIGTLANQTDSYYSAVAYFKVVNPFYSGSQGPSSNINDYELISNESPNGFQSENSGSFKINNNKYTFNKNMKNGAYKLDYVKPFDTQNNKDKRIIKPGRALVREDQVGQSKAFWVANLVTGQYNSMNAVLLYSGSHSNVWVNNNQITAQEAAQLGTEFDNKIHQSDVTNFGSESDVDGNGKVNILCYDIQDGFSGTGGYVAGYFSPQDLYNVSYSNRSEIFYIDTYPLMGMSSSKDVTAAYSTLAHEFQHMINFNQKVFIQGHSEMDTWMNEGLSMAAEQIYSGKALDDRIDYYNYDTDIANGHSLLNWDDYGDVLANYSLSYLFMQYLEVQCGQGTQIFKELINDSNSDYQAVEDLIQKYINPHLTFGQFMTDFRAALVLKQSSGLYGFHGDPAFSTIKERVYNGSSLNLDGGGAVVKPLNTSDDFSVPGDKGADVTYTLLIKDPVKPPSKPSVNGVGDNDTSVTGKADPSVNVFVSSNGKDIGYSTADSSGNFRVTIPKQSAGTVLSVYAQDPAGNKSSAATVTVSDKTAPAAPHVNAVSDASVYVTGKTEAKAQVAIKRGTTVIGTIIADSSGNFRVTIPKQSAGTVLSVYAQDSAGNKSSAATVTVSDKTAPAAPHVNAVSDASVYVTGKTEAKAQVTIKRGTTVIGTGTADTKGSFKIKISKQKANVLLSISAEDAAHNKSATTIVKVADKTPPANPAVSTFGDNQRIVSGKAEPGSLITIKLGKTVLGSSTASSKGIFHVHIKHTQRAGTVLWAFAKDKAGNRSSGKTFKVADKTAPGIPSVNKVTYKSTSVSGKAEKGATVFLYNGSKYLGKSTASSKGYYHITIHKQKKGSYLKLYAKDKAGNKSKYKILRVN